MSRQKRKTVVVCGGGQAESDSKLYSIAETVGQRLGEAGYSVATGGYGGVMEAALKGAQLHEVATVGVTLNNREAKPNQYVSAEVPAESYQARLMELINMGDAFVVLEGGTGTLLELAMVWALKSRKLIANCPIVCICEQWREVVETMSFYSEEALTDSSQLHFASSIDEAMELIERLMPLQD